ncbi:MAG: general secretion pathway protein GspK [Gammaproteobacteria bacterium]|nr:MAG: general secretion pathway protein GspK [Gammaproteobacteria bacterium]PIE37654.1 MAG: general secretion pathway protein GspK [Gammaproteobacteria bacterium]
MPLTRAKYRAVKQDGAALVVALLVFAVCAAVMVALQKEFDLFYRQVSNQLVSDQAQAYLNGAEALAALALKTDNRHDTARSDKARDDLTELWAQEATPYALDDGGWLLGQLEDLQGRFNLNTLRPGSAQGSDGSLVLTAAQEQFIRLLLSFSDLELTQYEAKAITLAIGDWLDADDIAAVNGAEDSYYLAQTPAYRAPNHYMTSTSELYAIANIRPDIVQALEPYVTVWPLSGGKVNIHTAPVQVLRSLNGDGNLNPLSEEEGLLLKQMRDDTGFADAAGFLEQSVFDGKNTANMATRITESSSFFLLDAVVDIADRKTRLYSVLERDGQKISVRARAAHSL